MRKNRIVVLLVYLVSILAVTGGLVAPLLISNNVLPVWISLGLGMGYFVGLFYLTTWIVRWVFDPKDKV